MFDETGQQSLQWMVVENEAKRLEREQTEHSTCD